METFNGKAPVISKLCKLTKFKPLFCFYADCLLWTVVPRKAAAVAGISATNWIKVVIW